MPDLWLATTWMSPFYLLLTMVVLHLPCKVAEDRRRDLLEVECELLEDLVRMEEEDAGRDLAV